MSRVQGAWASSNASSKPRTKNTNTTVPPLIQSRPFDVVYQENNEAPLMKPDDIIVKSEGEHILSKEPSGVSRIQFYPHFLPLEEADKSFAALSEELPWKQNSDKYGPQPRLTVWYGAHPYSYSGLTHNAYEEWHPILLDIRRKLESLTGHSFNSVLCNLYRTNHDSVDWHCDDEPALRKNPYIASVSLGEMRTFELRKKSPKERYGDFTYAQHVKMHLSHGSLVIMSDSTQEDWQHRIPKEYHDRDARINLTFRTIYSEND